MESGGNKSFLMDLPGDSQGESLAPSRAESESQQTKMGGMLRPAASDASDGMKKAVGESVEVLKVAEDICTDGSLREGIRKEAALPEEMLKGTILSDEMPKQAVLPEDALKALLSGSTPRVVEAVEVVEGAVSEAGAEEAEVHNSLNSDLEKDMAATDSIHSVIRAKGVVEDSVPMPQHHTGPERPDDGSGIAGQITGRGSVTFATSAVHEQLLGRNSAGPTFSGIHTFSGVHMDRGSFVSQGPNILPHSASTPGGPAHVSH